MTTYRRFIETCDHEGETWNFWLQVDGNMTALAVLGDKLDAINEPLIDRPFVLEVDQLDEPEVDLLIRFGESGYFMQHNKIDGSLQLPKNFLALDFEAVTDHLYKGAIRDFFHGGAE
ncbi:hypothetical protein ACIP5Y_21165 [Nocardia sp. NPDC088792]|uniref:hypothetical protein n=1 Tax=Nocardia sp. NPDC088792 TaxID=3364332 RepID=UPI00380690E5